VKHIDEGVGIYGTRVVCTMEVGLRDIELLAERILSSAHEMLRV
jgi:hypothetical protein